MIWECHANEGPLTHNAGSKMRHLRTYGDLHLLQETKAQGADAACLCSLFPLAQQE